MTSADVPALESLRIAAPSLGKSAYRPDIDGLRAIAVTSVVFYHAGLWPLASGYVGVDIFFVISGFLIGGIVNREVRSDKFTFAGFYARRARRILPALLAVVLIVSALSLLLMGASELRKTGLSAATALLGISNIYFWWSTNYFAPNAHLNPFLMTWSLGVEEQFYVFFPFVLILLSRLRQQIAALVIGGLSLASFLFCVFVTARYPTAAFYLLPMRAWQLGLGALLALLWGHPARLTDQATQNVLGAAGLVTVIGACLVFNDATTFPGVAALLPVAGTLALICAERSWVNRVILSSAPMVGIGLLSYSWYLWHAPLMALTRLVTFGRVEVGTMCIVAFVSLGCAYLSWRFIERPFRHGKLPDGPALRRYGLALAAVLALPVSFVALKGMPQRLGPHGKAVEQTLNQGRGNPCLLPYGASEPSKAAYCYPAQGATGRTVVLLGDSHAAALGGAFRTLAQQQGVLSKQYEKSSCAPLLGATRTVPAYPSHAAQCAAFNEAVFKQVTEDPTIGTVVLGAFWSASFQDDGDSRMVGTDPAIAGSQAAILQQSLERTIERYRSAGKRVIVLEDAPLFRFDPGKEAVGDILPVRDALRHLLGAPADVAKGQAGRDWLRPQTEADAIVKRIAEATDGADYYSLSAELCNATSCAYGADLPYYIDFQHLSQPGALRALANLKF